MSDFQVAALPTDLGRIFTTYESNPVLLIEAFMPALCNHIGADRIFIQPRNPKTGVCKMMRWRRHETIPWPKFDSLVGSQPGNWIVEEKWELDDPLYRAALQLKPSIYVEDLYQAASEGLLDLEFENKHMFHTAFIHGHARWPLLSSEENASMHGSTEQQFYGSVQPAVFDGPRVWGNKVRELMEKCLVRIAPVMKAYGDTAPVLQ